MRIDLLHTSCVCISVCVVHISTVRLHAAALIFVAESAVTK